MGCHDPQSPEPDTEQTPPPEVASVLVENHREFLRFLERRVGSRAVAEDILQDAFVKGLDKLSTLEAKESAVAWFYRLLRNAVVDHHRRSASASRALSSFAAEVAHSEAPEAEVRGAVCRCIAALADTLKPEYADAIRSVELEGMAVKDYAARAAISSNNAAVRVFRAREALRKQVRRSCGTCADHGCLDCTCDRGAGCST